MAISNDWNINYITKQINHLQWKDEINGTDSAVAQIQTITPVAVSGNITTGDYFKIYSAKDTTGYYVWYNVATGGGDPAPTGFTAIPVAVGGTDTAQQVSTATVTAINSIAGTDFTAANTGGTVVPITLTNDSTGSATAAATTTGLTGFTYAVGTPGIGKTVWSVNALYSYIQDTFDELGQMDDQVPMSAQTPTEYSLINQWFIDEVSIKYLRGGAIKTIGWTRVESTETSPNAGVVQITYSSATAEPVASDFGLPVLHNPDGDAGILLFADVTRNMLWIRPSNTLIGNSFNSTSGDVEITGGTGDVDQSAAAIFGENTWANMYSIGSIEANTAIYIVQDSTKITSWWPVGHIDVLIRVREMGSTTGILTGDLGQLFIGAREYSKLFDHFVSTGITGGRNPVPLATAADLNNTTGQYSATLSSASIEFSVGDRFVVNNDSSTEGTVTSISPATGVTTTIGYYLSGTSLNQFVNSDVVVKVGTTTPTSTINVVSELVANYDDITMTFGDTTQNLQNGDGVNDYDVIIDCNTKTVAQMYEWLKFVTRRGYTNSPQQLKYGTGSTADTNIPGEQYIDLLTSFTPVKASPFGTFAGGKFFGAQGVWITNYATTDAQNFQLIDASGATQIPPNTVSVTVSAVIAGDRIGVFPLTAEGGTVKKDTYSSATSGNNTGDADFVITGGTIDNETPQSGVLRVRQMGTATLVEQQYYYYSWTSATFTLNSSTARGLSLTVTGGAGGSATVLTDTEATFQTWKVAIGDTITNSTDGSTATVVSIDSQTQLTTTALTGGGNTYENTDVYTFATLLTQTYVSGDKAYVPIINETAVGTSVGNTLIKRKIADGGANIPVIVRVRQGKIILPFEIETIIGDNGMSQAAIRTPDTIAT